MNIQTGADSSILLKARMRHTRLFAGLVLLSLMVVQSRWLERGWVHENLEWLGYGLVILCVLGRSWCSAYIGGRKNYDLVTAGPYSVVRNPLYLFSFLGVLGIGLFSASLVVTAVMTLAFMLYYPAVVRREETYLTQIYGGAYRTYLARTPRWIPDPSLWRSPSEISVRPGYLLRTMRDSAVLFAAFPLIEGLEYLHAVGYLPTLLILP